MVLVPDEIISNCIIPSVDLYNIIVVPVYTTHTHIEPLIIRESDVTIGVSFTGGISATIDFNVSLMLCTILHCVHCTY